MFDGGRGPLRPDQRRAVARAGPALAPEVVAAVGPRPGERVLDLAAGHRHVAASRSPAAGATVVPCDFSLGHARRRQAARPAPAVHRRRRDCSLPFADDTFDAVTISLRAAQRQRPAAGLREMLRVTRPGGRLVVCEFSHPTLAPFRTLYTEYLMRALPRVARAVSSNPEAYVYLAESIRGLARPGRARALIGAAGWARVAWRNLTGGIVALHRGPDRQP